MNFSGDGSLLPLWQSTLSLTKMCLWAVLRVDTDPFVDTENFDWYLMLAFIFSH